MGNDDQVVRTPVRRADAMQRAAEGWQLRVMGKTWQQIADALGYASAQGAHRAVTRFAGSIPDPEPATLRKLWRSRMEALYAYAARDAKRARPGALRAAVAVAQRAAQLDGLDQPQRIQVETADVAELNAMVQVLMQQHQGELTEREASIWDDDDVEDADVVDDDVEDAPGND